MARSVCISLRCSSLNINIISDAKHVVCEISNNNGRIKMNWNMTPLYRCYSFTVDISSEQTLNVISANSKIGSIYIYPYIHIPFIISFIKTFFRIVPGESFFDKSPKVVGISPRKHFCNCIKSKTHASVPSVGGFSPIGGYSSPIPAASRCSGFWCSEDHTDEVCKSFDNIRYDNILTYSDITEDVKSEYIGFKTTGLEQLHRQEPSQLRDSPPTFLRSFGKNVYWKKSEPPEIVPVEYDDYGDYDEGDADLFGTDIFGEIGTDTT